MITDQDRDTICSIMSQIEPSDYFVFDTTALSTSLDAGQALYLVYLNQYAIYIHEAIANLYTFDITGCLDSGLL